MTFHEQLARATAPDREYLLSAPVIRRALAGDVTRELYVAFLTQAYHHVRHTVPLLMAVGARLPDRHAWLRDAVLHYLEEETGHEEWILNDIERAGGDRDQDQRAPHGRGALLAEVGLRTVLAHHLADLLLGQLADHPGPDQQRDRQRGQGREDGAQRQVPEDPEAPVVLRQPVERVKKHRPRPQ